MKIFLEWALEMPIKTGRDYAQAVCIVLILAGALVGIGYLFFFSR